MDNFILARKLIQTMDYITNVYKAQGFNISTIDEGPITIWVERGKTHFSMSLMTMDHEPVIKVVIAMSDRYLEYFDAEAKVDDIIDWLMEHTKVKF
jgi:hypothetical protein